MQERFNKDPMITKRLPIAWMTGPAIYAVVKSEKVKYAPREEEISYRKF